MKKMIVALIVCCMMFVITACKPEGMSDDVYKYGLKALETVDQYLDAEIELEEMNKIMEGLYDRFEDSENLDLEDFSVKLYINSLESKSGYLYSGVDEIKEARDNLASALNESIRYEKDKGNEKEED